MFILELSSDSWDYGHPFFGDSMGWWFRPRFFFSMYRPATRDPIDPNRLPIPWGLMTGYQKDVEFGAQEIVESLACFFGSAGVEENHVW